METYVSDDFVRLERRRCPECGSGRVRFFDRAMDRRIVAKCDTCGHEQAETPDGDEAKRLRYVWSPANPNSNYAKSLTSKTEGDGKASFCHSEQQKTLIDGVISIERVRQSFLSDVGFLFGVTSKTRVVVQPGDSLTCSDIMACAAMFVSAINGIPSIPTITVGIGAAATTHSAGSSRLSANQIQENAIYKNRFDTGNGLAEPIYVVKYDQEDEKVIFLRCTSPDADGNVELIYYGKRGENVMDADVFRDTYPSIYEGVQLAMVTRAKVPPVEGAIYMPKIGVPLLDLPALVIRCSEKEGNVVYTLCHPISKDGTTSPKIDSISGRYICTIGEFNDMYPTRREDARIARGGK